MIARRSCRTCGARCARDGRSAPASRHAALPARAQLRRRPAGVRRPDRRARRRTRATPRRWSPPGHAFLAAGHLRLHRRGAGRPAAADRARPAGWSSTSAPAPGSYLAAVLDALPGAVGLALDVSKPALRRAARAHPRAGAVLADAWRRLPLADARRGADPGRVRAPQRRRSSAGSCARTARSLVVTPGRRTTSAELVGPLGLLGVDPDKAERLAATLGPWFTLAGRAAALADSCA